MRAILTVMALAMLAACNNVDGGFRPVYTAQELEQRKDLVPFEGEPTIRDGGNPNVEFYTLFEEGWAIIGESRYAHNMTVPQQLQAKAKELKAEQVVKFRIGSNTTTGMAPISTGSGGMFFMPTASTVEYYAATFWRRRKPFGTGVFVRDLTQEEAIKRGDANGAVVYLLVKGFAGDRAGLRKGDIITHVGGLEVINAKDSNKAFESRESSSIDYRVIRDGKPENITVVMDPMPAE